NTSERWREFQQAALGMSFNEYVEGLAGPLAMLSTSWGLEAEAGPFLDPDQWLPASTAARDFVLGLTIDRAEARANIVTPEDGLPVGPTIFHHRPFVRLRPNLLVAASPWVVRGTAHAGLWGRHLTEAKRRWGKDVGAKRWLSAFGYLFEGWCRRIADSCAR